ncbi:MAG: hypothetical protein WC979_04310 [Candidatus Pacearchaeota archaeon]|jgi:hypothetical protein
MKYQKSQVTVFIILAIIVASLILAAIVYRPNEDIKTPDVTKIDPINSFVIDCLKETGEDAVSYIGYTGGYFDLPSLSTDDNIAYYFYAGEDLMPSKEKVEEQLSLYMNNMLSFCTKNFIDFPSYNITGGEVKTKTKIENNSVIFSVDYPLTISKENNNYKLEKFEDTEIPARLGVVYSTSRKIMDEQIFNPEDVCLTCILTLSQKNKVQIDLNSVNNSKGDNIIIFTITDTDSHIKDAEFKFNFANNYG